MWAFATGSSISSSPALGTDGTIYVGSDDNKLYAVYGDSASSSWPRQRLSFNSQLSWRSPASRPGFSPWMILEQFSHA
ncbi:MAG: PQQ-binding-like beta-propeller repeat protein [Deltaproteobacteria bacterium]|nr:PQQ-binding-like beta-propeller repeat protein [Deltaproteobacteria bacterium]